MDSEIIRHTFSLCPVCLKKVPAVLERKPFCNYVQETNTDSVIRTAVYMQKSCPEHGSFRVTVWKDRIDLDGWVDREDPLTDHESSLCSGDCRSCLRGTDSIHCQGTCCVILEVTKQCNLKCPYCFAYGGEDAYMPSFEELCLSIDDIAVKGGGPLIQLSGGEPTLRDDLPDLVRYARKAGCRYTQINTNGIRLADDEAYVKRLADAGLDIVFLQFDGTGDEIYRKLRGRELLDTKLKAINNCDRYGIGVTLVPTIVRGINEGELGNMVRKAAELFPAVRAVHFQPVTYLGRYPCARRNLDSTCSGSSSCDCIDHYTLDELMSDLCSQTGIPEQALLPSRCDHALCEFHSTFMVSSNRQLIPMTDRAFDVRRERTSAAENRKYVAEHWRRDRKSAGSGTGQYDLQELTPDMPLVCLEREDMDFDEFVRKMKTHTLKISAMAFQDAMNIDLERLYRCSLHVYEDGKLLPFCSKYLTTA